MDKKILEDYIDACEFIKETEAEIKKLEKKKRFVQDKVRGSNPDWPYEERSFSLGGSVETAADAFTLAREKRILEEQRKVASDLKLGSMNLESKDKLSKDSRKSSSKIVSTIVKSLSK